MKVDLYSSKGNKLSTKVELNDEIWDVPMNEDLIAQVMYVYRHNQRKGTAHSKTRGEVRGGGRKPWRQKGTGRARHGSIRSPLWVGGGVAFGPRSYKALKSVPRKMMKKALQIMLSQHLREGNLFVMKDLSAIKEGKTKEMDGLIKDMKLWGMKVAILVENDKDEMSRVRNASQNLPVVGIERALDVHPYEIANVDAVVVTQKAVETLHERLMKS